MDYMGLVKSNSILRYFGSTLQLLYKKCKINGFLSTILFNGIKINGIGCFTKDCIGRNNSVIVGNNSSIFKCQLHIRGNNNKIVIGENVILGPRCSLYIEGNNCLIMIGAKTTVTRDTQFCCQEDNQTIRIGEDCMFANTIVVRTSDSHPIYNNSTGQRINLPKSVLIGNHVWIAPNAKIMKGAIIGDGCIVASDSTVNKNFPPNTLIAGRPAKIIRKEISWTREQLFPV